MQIHYCPIFYRVNISNSLFEKLQKHACNTIMKQLLTEIFCQNIPNLYPTSHFLVMCSMFKKIPVGFGSPCKYATPTLLPICYIQMVIHKLCWQDFKDFWKTFPFRWQVYCISLCGIVDIWQTHTHPCLLTWFMNGPLTPWISHRPICKTDGNTYPLHNNW